MKEANDYVATPSVVFGVLGILHLDTTNGGVTIFNKEFLPSLSRDVLPAIRKLVECFLDAEVLVFIESGQVFNQ